MKKVVLKLEFYDDKIKQKAMQQVSAFSGVESIAIDSKDKKLTVTGDIDPVKIAGKLRKLCHTDVLSVGPAKEPEKKKEEGKKDEKKDDKKDGKKDDKKDDSKKGDDKKKDAKDDAVKAFPAYQYHYPPPLPYHQYPPPPAPAYYARSIEEDPNGCVIC